MEITSKHQAVALHRNNSVSETDLATVAERLASQVMAVVGKPIGDVCSHFGGDYWWHIAGSQDLESYFCNIPPSPPGLMSAVARKEEYTQEVMKWLKARNEYLTRALDQFDARQV